MRILLPLLIYCSLLSACDNATTRQWLDPDKEFAEFEQPDVPTISSTQEEAARQAIAAGDYGNAASTYAQLMDSKKATEADKIRYQIALADLDRRVGQFESALAKYDTVLAKQSNNLDALEGKGLALMAIQNIAEAGTLFKTVLAADPKRWRTLNALGILFTSKNMIPEAMAYFAEALTISRDNDAVLNNVGLSQAIARNWQRSEQAMLQAVRVASNPQRKKQIELNLAMIYGIQGQDNRARALSEKHLSGAALENNLGMYAHLANNQELAKTYLNQALTTSPTYYERAWKNLEIISGKRVSE